MSQINSMRLTISLAAANIVIFVLQQTFFNFTEIFSLTPVMAFGGFFWQFITYMFLHGSVQHLFLNMIGLFMFGSVVETILGWRRYIAVYIFSGLGSAFLYIALTGVSSTVMMLGASGAVFGVLTAYAFKFPKNWIVTFPGIPMPAALMVVFFVVIEFLFGVFDLQPGVANFGHLGGILTSLLIMFYWKKTEDKEEIMLSDW
jgi:membrane associated rhomboid family serine protease